MNLQLLLLIVYSIGNHQSSAHDKVILQWTDQNNGHYHHHYHHQAPRNISRRQATDPTFYGHPKTRQEMWHQSFNINAVNPQTDFAEQLVILLNKVVNKYLRACVSIVIYDQFVEKIDSVILQTFFQVC